MTNFVPIVLGGFCIILGIFNMKGNITSVHWYHRQRILPEDVLPFGRKIGLGTIIIGVSLLLFGMLLLASEKSGNDIFTIIGSVFLVVGIVAGLILSFYAIVKYNKSIF